MKSLTRERKIYAAVLVLVVGALVVDQLFPSPGEDEDDVAATALDDSAVDVDAYESLITAGPLRKYNHPVAVRLSRHAAGEPVDPANLRDVFRPDASWAVRPQPVIKPDSPTPVVDDGSMTAEQFRAKHQLEAVMMIDGVGYAILDGFAVLRPGNRIDGFKVIAVGDRTVEFRSETQTVTLVLPDGG